MRFKHVTYDRSRDRQSRDELSSKPQVEYINQLIAIEYAIAEILKIIYQPIRKMCAC